MGAETPAQETHYGRSWQSAVAKLTPFVRVNYRWGDGFTLRTHNVGGGRKQLRRLFTEAVVTTASRIRESPLLRIQESPSRGFGTLPRGIPLVGERRDASVAVTVADSADRRPSDAVGESIRRPSVGEGRPDSGEVAYRRLADSSVAEVRTPGA